LILSTPHFPLRFSLPRLGKFSEQACWFDILIEVVEQSWYFFWIVTLFASARGASVSIMFVWSPLRFCVESR
jgi:hypothetical protein